MNQASVRSTLRTQLLARANLISIDAEVHRYPPSDRATVLPTILFTEMSASSEGIDLASTESLRTYTLSGQAYATTTGGASDDDWDDADINLTTLLEELIGTLEDDPTIGGTCGYAQVTSFGPVTPAQDPDSGRTYMSAEFIITITQVE